MSDPLIHVPSDLIPFSSFGSAIDLYGHLGKYKPAKSIVCTAGTGTVTVTMAGSKGASRVLPFAAVGDRWDGEFISIVSVSGVTGVMVGWNA